MKKAGDYPAKKMVFAKSRFCHSSRLLLPIIPLCLLIFVYCGGGGGGGGGDGVGTQEELAGQYTLTGITLEMSDGLVLTEQDLEGPWSGFADIGHTTVSIQLTFLGDTTQIGGSYTATWTSPTGGTLFDGFDTISFTLSGGKLTFIYENWPVDVGLTANMWLYWQKVSDSHTSLSLKRESVGENDVNVFESVSQLMKSLMK